MSLILKSLTQQEVVTPSVNDIIIKRQFASCIYNSKKGQCLIFGGYGCVQSSSSPMMMKWINNNNNNNENKKKKKKKKETKQQIQIQKQKQKNICRNRLNDTIIINRLSTIFHNNTITTTTTTTTTMYSYSHEISSIYNSGEIPIKARMHHCSVILDNHMFVFGGRGNPNQLMNDGWCMNLKNLKWYKVMPIAMNENDNPNHCIEPTARYRHGMCVLGGGWNVKCNYNHNHNIKSKYIIIFGGVGYEQMLLNDCYILELLEEKEDENEDKNENDDNYHHHHHQNISSSPDSTKVLSSQRISDNFIGTIPSARCSFAMDYIPSMHAIILYGGMETLQCDRIPTFDHNLYMLYLESWKWNIFQTTGNNPPAMYGHKSCLVKKIQNEKDKEEEIYYWIISGGLTIRYDDINSFTIEYNNSIWLLNINKSEWIEYKWNNEIMKDYMLIGHCMQVWMIKNETDQNSYHLEIMFISGGITVLFYGQVHVPILTCSIPLSLT